MGWFLQVKCCLFMRLNLKLQEMRKYCIDANIDKSGECNTETTNVKVL